MNCRDVEKLIYLYGELRPEQTQAVDEHLAQCPACQAQHRSWQQQRKQFRTLPGVGQAPDEAVRLTDRIMAAIDPPVTRPAGMLYSIKHGLGYWFMRYAMAAVSLCLVVFFLYEQYRIPAACGTMPKRERGEAPAGRQDEPVLNSGAFYEAFKSNRSPAFAGDKLAEFYHCIRQCSHTPANCDECKMLYPKLYRKYEDI